MSRQHPLDPLTPDEIRTTTGCLQKFLAVGPKDLRIKVVDLAEPAKAQTIEFLRRGGRRPDRRARVYYQRNGEGCLLRAIVNITTVTVEQDERLPDAQGPVDWTEYAAINDRCNTHPDVLAEVEKLKLPAKYDFLFMPPPWYRS